MPDKGRQLMSISEDSLVESGQIMGFHGLRGDLKVKPLSGDPEALLTAAEVFLRLPGGKIEKARPLRQSKHKGAVLIRLEGYDGLSKVEGFRGCKILLDRDSLPELAEDEYYWHQIEGARVIDRTHGDLGELRSEFSTAAHGIWVVEGDRGEVMIPVVDGFILHIDPQEKLIEVDLPEGLVESNDEI